MQAEARGDLAVGRIASAQRGLITRSQLTAAGLGRGSIAHRVAYGRLHRVHRGVYLVGHAVAPPLAAELAAVLACGHDARLSHRSAAGCWALLPGTGGAVDVTVAGRDCGERPGVRVHRVRRLHSRDVTTRRGIPITSPARTLLDLADLAGDRELERALDEALTQRLLRREQLLALIARAPGRRGITVLRSLLERERDPSFTRSEAEEGLLALVRAARLPSPQVNERVGRHEIDFHWSAEHLAVEVDGYAFHSSRAAFERDRLRDAELGAAGIRVMRITWRHIVDEPEAVVARLAQALVPRDGSG